MEKQEARSLRMALEDMDLMAEQQLHKAAQDEASELVWKHRNPNNNPNAPYPLPEKSVNYREHLRKGSHARSQSWSTLQDAAQGTRSSSTSRSASGGSVSGNDVQQDTTKRVETTNGAGDGGNSTQGPERSATYPQLTNEPGVSPVDSTDALFSQRGRRRLSNSRRKSSGPFINPNDQIYEEPEEVGELVSHPTAQPEVQPVPAQVPEKKHAESISPFKNRRNPFSRVQQAKDSLVRSQTEPIPQNPSYRPLTKRLFKTSTTTIVTPSSDVSGYVSNPSSASPTPPGSRGSLEENIKTKEGKEVRGDDIRAATSMRMRDRSPKLPQPTMVSDSPGRPIVSFQQAWKPKEKELEEVVSKAPESKTPQPGRFSLKSRKDDPLPAPPKEYGLPAADSRRSVPPATTTQEKPRPIPTISVSESSNAKPKTIPSITFSDPTSSRPKPPVKNERPVAIPTINFPDEPSSSRRNQSVPSISVNSVPSISVTVDPAPSTSNSTRPLPTISVSGAPPAVPSIVVDSGSSRPLPTPRRGPGFARPNAGASRHGGASHWTPSTFNTGALCSHCALPISGRTVSAAGARFHPECFGCFHCGEKLECVAFYPEPDNVRAERLDRIHRRQAGEMIEGFVTGGVLRGTEADDGDEGMRFYCHLDFHEFFSPRCKSCKTPIEGEVVVACGAEWHVGHFFCAQCGDVSKFLNKKSYKVLTTNSLLIQRHRLLKKTTTHGASTVTLTATPPSVKSAVSLSRIWSSKHLVQSGMRSVFVVQSVFHPT